MEQQPTKLLDQLRDALRRKHAPPRTEKAYVGVLRDPSKRALRGFAGIIASQNVLVLQRQFKNSVPYVVLETLTV